MNRENIMQKICSAPSCKSDNVAPHSMMNNKVVSYRCLDCGCHFPVEPHPRLSMYDQTPVEDRHKE
jgi:transposase-like protein